MLKSSLKLVFLASLFFIISCDDSSGGSSSDMNIVELINKNDDLSLLASALVRADLVTTLSSGNLTVFAPSNDAFATLLKKSSATSLDELDGSIDFDQLLPYHVADTFYSYGDLSDGIEITTLQGQTITVDVDQFGEVSLLDANNQKVTFLVTDVYATNGVVHVISGVVQPRI